MQNLTFQLYVTYGMYMQICKVAQSTFQPEQTEDRNSNHYYSR